MDLFVRSSHQHLVAYPIERGALINIVAFVTSPSAYASHQPYPDKSWVTDVSVEELRGAFEGFEDEVGELLQVRFAVFTWSKVHEE